MTEVFYLTGELFSLVIKFTKANFMAKSTRERKVWLGKVRRLWVVDWIKVTWMVFQRDQREGWVCILNLKLQKNFLRKTSRVMKMVLKFEGKTQIVVYFCIKYIWVCRWEDERAERPAFLDPTKSLSSTLSLSLSLTLSLSPAKWNLSLTVSPLSLLSLSLFLSFANITERERERGKKKKKQKKFKNIKDPKRAAKFWSSILRKLLAFWNGNRCWRRGQSVRSIDEPGSAPVILFT